MSCALAKDNKSLGKFQLAGIPPAPRGVPQIEVSFEIDANGILQVGARDKGTGREQSVRITNTGGLTQSEIEQMKLDAEINAEDDQRRKQLVELRNQADGLFYSWETTLRDNDQFITDDLKAEANERVAELRAAIADRSISVEAMKQRLDALQQALFAIGASVYQQTNQDETEYGYSDDTSIAEDNGSVGSTLEEEFEYGFENDDTVTADYEAVD